MLSKLELVELHRKQLDTATEIIIHQRSYYILNQRIIEFKCLLTAAS